MTQRNVNANAIKPSPPAQHQLLSWTLTTVLALAINQTQFARTVVLLPHFLTHKRVNASVTKAKLLAPTLNYRISIQLLVNVFAAKLMQAVLSLLL